MEEAEEADEVAAEAEAVRTAKGVKMAGRNGAPATQTTHPALSVTSIGASARGRGTVPTDMDAHGETTRAQNQDTIETSPLRK